MGLAGEMKKYCYIGESGDKKRDAARASERSRVGFYRLLADGVRRTGAGEDVNERGNQSQSEAITPDKNHFSPLREWRRNS